MANESPRINPNLIITGGLLVAGYFVGKNILEAFGIIDSKKKQEQEASIKAALNADVFNDSFQIFSTKCYNFAKSKNPNLSVLSFFNNAGFNPYDKTQQLRIQQKAVELYGAKAGWTELILTLGIVHDEDNVVLGIMQQAPTQIYISALNQAFYNLYTQSMIDYCNGFMDSGNVARIEDIIKNKPMYLK